MTIGHRRAPPHADASSPATSLRNLDAGYFIGAVELQLIAQ
jgi:hypothetical protein